ncbi:DUF4249 family protein [uncultured Dokdonia sp.]|uniref:DUF4249 family protein n=1 Tax=uncultured Dokdonia sp. TaxID=575653 RepID=UPI00260ECCA1|nr:DUF4249 family protein [uncultured Dokdonia sp.]
MRYITLLIALLLVFTSCEDVIDVDLNDEDPRLIVDALIRIDTTQQLTAANIKVSLSSSFFGEIQPAEVENMFIQKSDESGFVPYEAVPGEPGVYRPFATTVSPVTDNKIVTSWLTSESEYLFFVTHQGQDYFARTTFAPSVPIDTVEQGDGGLFDEDDKEVIIAFTDIPEQENYYLIDLDFNEYLPTEDRFYPGQQFEFSYFYDAEDTPLNPGDTVDISILGANEQFYDYMNGLLEQSEQGDNGPFQTPTATVRGNILNITDIDNIDQFDNLNRPDAFILGYFSLSQQFSASLIIEE